MKIPLIIMMALLQSGAAEEGDSGTFREPDIYERMLAQQLAGEYANYQNATPEWKLILEARMRHTMFIYWVNIVKFKAPRSKSVEARFGELASLIKTSGAFQRTFVEPDFIRGSEPFPKHQYVSKTGERFKIGSIKEFAAENKKFLLFLEECTSPKPKGQ